MRVMNIIEHILLTIVLLSAKLCVRMKKIEFVFMFILILLLLVKF